MKAMIQKTVAVVTVMLVLAGCATSGGGNPEAMVQETLESWKMAIQAKDIDAIMSNYSEDFENYDWGDKAGARDFLSGAIDQGYLDDIKIITEDAETTIEGETATVGPVDMVGTFGAISFDLSFAKEEGGWHIIGTETSGM